MPIFPGSSCSSGVELGEARCNALGLVVWVIIAAAFFALIAGVIRRLSGKPLIPPFVSDAYRGIYYHLRARAQGGYVSNVDERSPREPLMQSLSSVDLPMEPLPAYCPGRLPLYEITQNRDNFYRPEVSNPPIFTV
ncbi:hypothetical protein M422DRAFT_784430 [Sphaerobolus stellatus SS14]|uniref:Uncharacterized protein n=1 Tax=Sphaerobolus stellatus (strain SS14) TaxID=990650 RepID=A0A0C9UUH6_SPHS4|nr:hypothetical protein M422DRAFT_784430 [Sphaerobolus stellatus SS14]